MQDAGKHLARSTLAALLLVLSACAPQSAPAGQGASQAPPAQTPKTLTVGLLRQPANIEGFTGEGGTAGGAGTARYLIHDHLTVQDDRDVARPQLAVEVPSIEKGTWRVNPDG